MSSDRDSILDGLKTEWALFWDSLLGEESGEEDQKDPFETGKIELLSIEKIKEILVGNQH